MAEITWTVVVFPAGAPPAVATRAASCSRAVRRGSGRRNTSRMTVAINNSTATMTKAPATSGRLRTASTHPPGIPRFGPGMALNIPAHTTNERVRPRSAGGARSVAERASSRQTFSSPATRRARSWCRGVFRQLSTAPTVARTTRFVVREGGSDPHHTRLCQRTGETVHTRTRRSL